MDIDEHDECFDGFTSWEEVRSLLQNDDWTALRDERQRLEVRHGGYGLIAYEWRLPGAVGPGEQVQNRVSRGAHAVRRRRRRLASAVA